MNQLLIGTYECKLDAKGRFLLSSGLRQQLGDSFKQGFVLKKGLFDEYLDLYPMNVWRAETEKILEKTKLLRKNADYLRRFVASAKIVEVDSHGRIQIPKDLFNFAHFEKNIVITSVLNKIEIWDKQKYQKAIEYDQDDFSDLTEELFGGSEN
ncbi:MAG: division/cell wall cluster transcriptional repressor MraZ [Bacteroidales bacterium]